MLAPISKTANGDSTVGDDRLVRQMSCRDLREIVDDLPACRAWSDGRTPESGAVWPVSAEPGVLLRLEMTLIEPQGARAATPSRTVRFSTVAP